jgi:hypothetical protein
MNQLLALRGRIPVHADQVHRQQHQSKTRN